jgi:hypothetical protein
MERMQLTLLPGSGLLQPRDVVGPGLVVEEPEVLARLVPCALSGRRVEEVVLLSALVGLAEVLAPLRWC